MILPLIEHNGFVKNSGDPSPACLLLRGPMKLDPEAGMRNDP